MGSFLANYGVDLIVGTILLLSTLSGIARGFFREIISTAVWVLSFVITYVSYKALSAVLIKELPSLIPQLDRLGNSLDVVMGVVAAVIIFTISLLVLQLVFSAFFSSFSIASLKPIDKFLGMVLGVLKGLVLLGSIWAVFNIVKLDKGLSKYTDNAVLFPPVEITAKLLQPIFDSAFSLLSKDKGVKNMGVGDIFDDMITENQNNNQSSNQNSNSNQNTSSPIN